MVFATCQNLPYEYPDELHAKEIADGISRRRLKWDSQQLWARLAGNDSIDENRTSTRQVG
jgi:hypothetical protein